MKKQSESKVSVRVPAKVAAAVPSLTAHFFAVVEEAVTEKWGELIRKKGYAPVIHLLGVELVTARSLLGGSAEFAVLVGSVEMGGIRCIFEVEPDGRNWVTRDEIVIGG